MLKLPIKLPGKKAFAIDTSKDLSMPSLHMLSIAAGTRGSGKSVAVSSLIAHARERDFLDRVLLISPTYPSNREIWNVAGIKEEDVYEPTKTVVETIKTFIKQEKDEWDEFLEQKKKWDRYQNLISSPNLNMRSTKTLEELMLYSQMGFFDEEPEWKYANGKEPHSPRLLCIIDDAMGTELMQGGGGKSGLVKLCIAHRHWSEIGISIIMCVQSWCSKTGVDRSLREQMTNVMLWKVCQEKALERIWSENDVDMPYDQFKRMTEYVWSVPHRFLFIDFSPKKPEMKFRMNFDTVLNPADFSVGM
tara:strand:- start:3514 stop:4425 length:912 start_codon:yes stop_codon:yes gene_type:complete